MKIKKYLTQTENENNYTVANAQSQDLNIKSLGLNSNSFISGIASSQSDFMALLAFCATQMASSTWEQQKSLGAFGVYRKRWIMEKIVDRSTELYLESFNFKIVKGSQDSVVAG